jgi:hypothetical protein
VAVGEEIEQLLQAVESAATRSALRDEPDRDFIGSLVAQIYRVSMLNAG